MTTYFAGTVTPKNTDWSITSNGSGATLYAFVLSGSRAEWSELSPAKQVSYNPASPNFSITFNASIRPSGTWVWEAAVAFSATNNPADAVFAGAWRGYELDQITSRTLPATLSFNHTQLVKTTAAQLIVPNAAALLTITPKIHGMVRTVTSEGGAAYRWDAVINQWIPWRSVSAYNFASRKPAIEVNPAVDWFLSPPTYPSNVLAENEPSTPIKYWLQNDGVADWTSGSAIDLQCSINDDLAKGTLLSGLVKAKPLGVAGSDGILDSSFAALPNINVVYTWHKSSQQLFELKKSVPPGSCLLMEVWLQYYKSQLIVPNGSSLQAIPLNTGKFSYQLPGFSGFQDWLVGLRLLPKLGGLSDSGGTARIGEWTFSHAEPGAMTNPILLPTNGSKQVVINAQTSQLRIEPIGTEIDNVNTNTSRTEGIVGYVHTTPGVCTPSSPVLLSSSSGSINITIDHPTSIGLDYPVIGGLPASINVPKCHIYLTISGTIYRTTIDVVSGTQEIPVTSLGTIVSSIPSSSFLFDLFTIPTPILADGGSGTLPANTQISCVIQYAYPDPNTAASIIEMEGAGMLLQQSSILGGSTEGFWGVLNPTQLRQLDSSNYTGKEWGRVIFGSLSKPFRFDNTSVAADDGLSVIKPNDRSVGRYVADLEGIPQGSYGDITISSTGTMSIAPGAVTLPKITNVPPNTVLARIGSTTGPLSPVTIQQLSEELDWSAAFPAGDYGDLSFANNIFTVKPNAISLAKLTQIPAGTVLANLSGSSSVPSSVTLATLSAAMPFNIADGSLSFAKLSPIAAGYFIGNTSGSAAAPSAIPISSLASLVSPTLGNGNYGDIQVSNNGTIFTINPNAVSVAKLAQIPAGTVLANTTNSAATPTATAFANLASAFPANSFTLGKVEQIPSGHILGNLTNSTANVVATSIANLKTALGVSLPDGSFGDVAISGNGTLLTVQNNVIGNAKLAKLPANTILGNLTGASADASYVTLASLSAALSLSSLLPNGSYGDITSSSNGAILSLNSNVVTYSKIQQATAKRILGNPGNSQANVSEIALDSSLTFAANSLRVTNVESLATPSINSGVLTLDLSVSYNFKVSFSANITSFNITNMPSGLNSVIMFILYLDYSGAQRTLPATSSFLRYNGVTAPITPAAAGQTLQLGFLTNDNGSSYLISSNTFGY